MSDIKPDDLYGVRGGQGRSADELYDVAVVLALVLAASCLAFVVGMAYQSL